MTAFPRVSHTPILGKGNFANWQKQASITGLIIGCHTISL
ncbi:hypothetical protein SP19_34 [Salmonella phage 19]|nr:hypothetical protein SP19_34 [Salmonella phage 19]